MKFLGFLILLTFLSSTFATFTDNLKNYEKLNLNSVKFKHLTSQKSKRDAGHDFVEKYLLNTNEFKFHAFGRDFSIYLKKHLNVLSDNVSIEVKFAANNTNRYLKDTFTANYYVGFVDDPDVSSYVMLYYDQKSVFNGKTVIYGRIELGDETYYIEPSSIENQEFIIYKASDVHTELLKDGIFNSTFCRQKKILQPDTEAEASATQSTKNAKAKRSALVKNRCKIALVADHRFYKEIGNSNEQLTTLHMINVMTVVSGIFERTQFGEDIKDFGFDIEKIIVHTDAHNDDSHYNSRKNHENADNVLDLFGVVNWSEYCLAHLFTFNAFEGNVLGLAYVSSPRVNAYGGMCSRLMTRNGRQFSSNVGLSSYKSPSGKQRRLFQTEAELVTTHELGHNWGSEHDPATDRCTPSSSSGGNYIMYAYSNQGYDANNHKFSPCSVISMTEVLKAKSHTCFKEKSKSFCGNSRIEAEEQCDDGLRTRNGSDPCCDSNCRFRSNAKCSDANHDCCTNCTFAPQSYVCFSSKAYHECYEQKSYCTGDSKTCPEQKPKGADKGCSLHESGKCNGNGQCLSLCKQKSPYSDPCFCKSLTQRCVQCCTDPLNASICLAYHELFPGERISYLSDGRTCLEGRCENRKCLIKVKDHVGRFWNVIETLASNAALEFMKRNIVGTVIILSLILWIPFSCFIHFCIDKRLRAEQKQQYTQKLQRNSRTPRHLSDVVNETQKQALLMKSDTVF